MTERKFYTVEQFAEVFQVTPKRVRDEIYAGRLRALKLGERTIRIPEAEITRISEHGFEKPKNEPAVSAAG